MNILILANYQLFTTVLKTPVIYEYIGVINEAIWNQGRASV